MKFDDTPMIGQKISIMIVEDDPHVLAIMTDAIASAQDLCLQRVARTRKEGLQGLQGPSTDVLLVDLGLPDGSGIDIIKKAHTDWPECAIMVSTTFGDERHVMESLQAGAAGYLLKDSSEQSIALEIRNLYHGGSPISPLIARQILKRLIPPNGHNLAYPAAPSDYAKPARLSPREIEVLQLITKGFIYEEIAVLLNVSRNTILSFVRRIYSKLEVNSKSEAIYEAKIQGLLHD
jgi:DNA-binding NarL/FixJ family response regulator